MNRLRELENLLATKGTEAFWDVFEKVRALKAADVKALAREFSGKRASSKLEALSLIWARHKNIVDAKRAAGTTGSRLAG